MTTTKKMRLVMDKMKPCECGGQLCIGKSFKISTRGVVHIKIKCRKCGAWHGGITIKEQPTGGKLDDKRTT